MNEPSPADRRFYMVSMDLRFIQSTLKSGKETVKGYVHHLGIQASSLAHLGKLIDEALASESAELEQMIEASQLEIDMVDGKTIASHLRKNGGQCDMSREIFYRSGRIYFTK